MILLLNFLFNSALGSSCCVGNTSLPNLMTIPAKWQFSSQVSYSKVIGDATPRGDYVFRDSQNKDVSQVLRLDLAHQYKFWQFGLGGQFIQKNRQSAGTDESSQGTGDIFLYGAHEFAINYEKFYPLVNFRIPTAPSNYDARNKLQTDARGAGVPEVSTGLLWVHINRTWDTQVAPVVFYRFSRTFHQEDDEINVGSQWGGALMMGAGFVPWKKKYRLSTSITPRYESSKYIKTNGVETKTERTLVMDSLLSLTWMINAYQNLGFNYLDQTLIGPARNTLLNRSGSLVFQERW